MNASKVVLRHDFVLLATFNFSFVLIPGNLERRSAAKLTLKMDIRTFQSLNWMGFLAENRGFYEKKKFEFLLIQLGT